MRTILLSIFMFALGFIIGGGLGVNFTLNNGFDYIVDSVGNASNLPKDATAKMRTAFEKKKNEMLKEINSKKDELIIKIKDNIKNQLKKQIENIFK